jgi:hypothetical protein
VGEGAIVHPHQELRIEIERLEGDRLMHRFRLRRFCRVREARDEPPEQGVGIRD